jgi:hypothetical protein
MAGRAAYDAGDVQVVGHRAKPGDDTPLARDYRSLARDETSFARNDTPLAPEDTSWAGAATVGLPT